LNSTKVVHGAIKVVSNRQTVCWRWGINISLDFFKIQTHSQTNFALKVNDGIKEMCLMKT